MIDRHEDEKVDPIQSAYSARRVLHEAQRVADDITRTQADLRILLESMSAEMDLHPAGFVGDDMMRVQDVQSLMRLAYRPLLDLVQTWDGYHEARKMRVTP